MKPRANVLRRPFIGEQKLDTLKTLSFSAREAIEERQLVNIWLRLAARRGIIPLSPHSHRQR
jgi:hypothetical protein